MSLPEGWTVTNLGEACSLLTDGTHHSPSNSRSGDFPYITAKHIKWPGLKLDDLTYVSRDEHDEIYRRCPVIEGDVLLIKDGATTGVATINHLREPFSMLSSVALLRPVEELLSNRYLWYWLRSESAQFMLIGSMSGSAIQRLTLTKIGQTDLPIPPLAEQHRIVAKLDALTARLARARAELDRVPLQAERLRETAITTTFQSWERRALQEVSNDIRYGFTASAEPSGPGSKFLRITDIRDRKVDWSTVPFVQPEAKDIERCGLRTGDIVFARSGATVGKSFLLKDPPPDAVFASYLIRVRVNFDFILPEVAAYYFQSGEYWGQIRAGATGTGQPNFNGSKLAKLLVPVGSRKQQEKAIHMIELAYSHADRLEAEAARARSLVDRLEAAVFAKAFRGELVTQDPNDEPASVLLDRIRAQRAVAPKPKRGRRAKVS